MSDLTNSPNTGRVGTPAPASRSAEEQDWYDNNRALWDNKVGPHLNTEMYDMAAFRAGKCSLKPAELEGLGDVSGKKLLHLQCHFGQDSISWARRGASVTAVDFSTEAVRTARDLSAELGTPVDFIECNVYDLQQHLDAAGEYDIVFTSYGTIVWLPDLSRWAQIVNHFLKPGGTFFIAEFHPVMQMLDWEGDFGFLYSYFNTGKPFVEDVQGTYADREADVTGKEFFWNHGFQEVFQSLLSQGLQMEDFREFSYSYWNAFPETVQGEDGWYRFKRFGDLIPMMYALKMRKPS